MEKQKKQAFGIKKTYKIWKLLDFSLYLFIERMKKIFGDFKTLHYICKWRGNKGVWGLTARLQSLKGKSIVKKHT